MKGKLYGIGVGPGDPELLTLKAVKTIQKCGVIAIPKAGDNESAASEIIEQYLTGKELVECRFAMEKEIAKRKEARQIAANYLIGYLDKGQDVGFVTLGDPTTYSTYMYIHEIIINKGFETEIIPGITSYAAAAAALGIALCEDNEPLTIIPAGSIDNKLLDYPGCMGGQQCGFCSAASPGTKVIMKSGENLSRVLAKLKEHGYEESTKIAYRVAMDGQRLYASIEEYEKSAEHGYFTTIIAKNK